MYFYCLLEYWHLLEMVFIQEKQVWVSEDEKVKGAFSGDVEGGSWVLRDKEVEDNK
jgi:hypothetical protein